jgi:hypothetical protein
MRYTPHPIGCVHYSLFIADCVSSGSKLYVHSLPYLRRKLANLCYNCFPYIFQPQHVTSMKADPKSHPDFALKFNIYFFLYKISYLRLRETKAFCVE